MPMPKLSSQEYKNEGGNRCPFCLSPDIEGGAIETDSGGAWQQVECTSCSQRWNDHYALISYLEIEL